MTQPISNLTQSRFYSPAFNAAIFDGPIRIYFAQYQEAQALKIYFHLQERLKRLAENEHNEFIDSDSHLFVMLYPTGETFDLSFEEVSKEKPIAREKLGSDFVLGIRGPINDSQMQELSTEFDTIVGVC